MTMSEKMKELLTEGAKSTPPVAVVAHQAATGWTLNHTLTALTILYVAAQLGYLVWKWWNERAERTERHAQRGAYGVEP